MRTKTTIRPVTTIMVPVTEGQQVAVDLTNEEQALLALEELAEKNPEAADLLMDVIETQAHIGHVIVVLDTSSSMTGRHFRAAKKKVIAFLQKTEVPVEVRVVTFAELGFTTPKAWDFMPAEKAMSLISRLGIEGGNDGSHEDNLLGLAIGIGYTEAARWYPDPWEGENNPFNR